MNRNVIGVVILLVIAVLVAGQIRRKIPGGSDATQRAVAHTPEPPQVAEARQLKPDADESTQATEPRQIRINFQPWSSITPPGYVPDIGLEFGDRGNGLVFGWVGGPATESRARGKHPDPRRDTFIHFSKGASQLGPMSRAPSATGGVEGVEHAWAINLAGGLYRIEVVMGDPSYADHLNSIVINGVEYPDAVAGPEFDTVRAEVRVTDGRLTICAR